MGMGLDPPYLSHSVLCIRLCFWSTAGVLVVQAVQSGGRFVQAKISQDPFGRWLRGAREDPLRSRDQYQRSQILAGWIRCVGWFGGRIGKAACRCKTGNKDKSEKSSGDIVLEGKEKYYEEGQTCQRQGWK